MNPQAILLDLDDTILAFDYGLDLDRCWREVCGRHLPIDEDRVGDTVRLIKERARWYWSDPGRHQVGRLDLDKARTEIIAFALDQARHDPTAAERIAVDYGVERDRAMHPYPGSVETLQLLRDRGIKLALITNGSTTAQRRKIERFGLAPFFESILIEEEFGAGKPDPSVYEHALRQLGVAAGEAWMVGDNYEWEIVAPQKLGIKGIWVNPKEAPPLPSAPPFRTIRALRDIVGCMENS
jgi:putative hydrolase of the HAD superfamily